MFGSGLEEGEGRIRDGVRVRDGVRERGRGRVCIHTRDRRVVHVLRQSLLCAFVPEPRCLE